MSLIAIVVGVILVVSVLADLVNTLVTTTKGATGILGPRDRPPTHPPERANTQGTLASHRFVRLRGSKTTQAS